MAGWGYPLIHQNNYFCKKNIYWEKNLETLQNGLKHEKNNNFC